MSAGTVHETINVIINFIIILEQKSMGTIGIGIHVKPSSSRRKFTGAGFNGRADGFTCVDSARPVADQ